MSLYRCGMLSGPGEFHVHFWDLAIKTSALVSLLTVIVPMAQADQPGTSKRAEFLISARDLNSQREDSKIRVLDVREQKLYSAGHISGAVWLDINLWRSKGAEQFGLKDSAFWSKELGRLGIDQEKRIVIVGEVLTETARCWWVLKYLGMSDVRLLDGGLAEWSGESYPVSSQETQVNPTTPKIEFQAARLAALVDVLPDARKTTKCQILDNRSKEEFNGSRQLGARGGHIPGATHLEWNQFVSANGKLLADDELKKLIAAHQVDLNKPIVAHCQTGGRSSVVALVAEMLGGKNVRNYLQGWSEYSGQLQAPIE